MTATEVPEGMVALKAEACGAVSEDAIRHLKIRDQVNRHIYRAVRGYRMSNMQYADDPGCAFPLVDLMSNEPPADIGTGEMEMIALADEIAEAVAPFTRTPDPEHTRLRELNARLVEGLAVRDMKAAQCPDSALDPSKDCPKCGASSNQGCRLTPLADANFVHKARTLLAEVDQAHG